MIRSLGPPKETGPLRQGEAEMPPGVSDKLSRAVSRLLAAGQLAEIVYPDGRKSTTFVMPEGLHDEEVQKLNDPTLTHVLVGKEPCARCPLSARLRRVMAPTNQIAHAPTFGRRNQHFATVLVGTTPRGSLADLIPYHTDKIGSWKLNTVGLNATTADRFWQSPNSSKRLSKK